eukprot:TRINITY_DN26612_c0_g1_i1.p1 TRINITY_DN26612_c0_g1~~TRINITY_DN26612_c0_g1_i1.p1  ORF type:complete len:913 (-),score=214.15 TRINITY_DN26612_c0_g1_i1:211-2949(-)
MATATRPATVPGRWIAGGSKRDKALTPVEGLLSDSAVFSQTQFKSRRRSVQKASAVERSPSRGSLPEPLSRPSSSGGVQRLRPMELHESTSQPSLRAVKALDKRVTGEFNRKMAQQGKSGSLPSLRSTATKLPAAWSLTETHMDLSITAKRENYKKERYAEEIERGQEAEQILAKSTKNRDSSLAGDLLEFEPVVASPEAFEKEVKDFHERIEQGLQRIRGHSEDNEAERKAAEREAERRRLEEAKRRARLKEAQARDPKKKINLRLENKRTYEWEAVERGDGIPLMTIDVPSISGHEKVNVVDVRTMVRNCKGLQERAGVPELLEAEVRKEKWERLLSFQSTSSPSNSMMSATWIPSKELTWDERNERAKLQRDANRANALIHKLGTMRSQLGDQLPFSFVVSERDNTSVLNIGLHRSKSSQKSQVASELAKAVLAVRGGDNSSFSDISELEEEIANCKNEEAIASLLLSKRFNSLRERGSAITAIRRMKSSIAGGDVDKIRVNRNWRVTRACVKMFWLFFNVKRKNRCIDVVKGLMRQYGEWARLRNIVQRVSNAARLIQAAARQFLSNKRKRCEHMSRVWCKVEDCNLQLYFKALAHELMESRKNKALQGGYKGNVPEWKTRTKEHRELQEFYRQLEDLNNQNDPSGCQGIDWKAFRIPEKERAALISRFYMLMLRKHVHSQRRFFNVVMSCVQSELELYHFLKEFGAQPTSTLTVTQAPERENAMERQASVEPPQPIHHQFSEQTALQLIALAAQALVYTEKRFQEHPACKDLPTDFKSRSRQQRRSSIVAGQEIQEPSTVVSKIDLSNFSGNSKGQVELGAFAKTTGQRRQVEVQSGEGNQKESDLERLFLGFTPRLREIVEEQAVEYRREMSTAAAPEASGGTAHGIGQAGTQSPLASTENVGSVL